MRWTADDFWQQRGDVEVTTLQTSNDRLRTAFLAGATEAEVPDGDRFVVRVAGLGWLARQQLRLTLNRQAPIRPVWHRVKRLRED